MRLELELGDGVPIDDGQGGEHEPVGLGGLVDAVFGRDTVLVVLAEEEMRKQSSGTREEGTNRVTLALPSCTPLVHLPVMTVPLARVSLPLPWGLWLKKWPSKVEPS